MSSLILLFSLLVPGAGAVSAQPEELRMWMTVGERRFAVTLIDNAAARAFAAQLPLTLAMSELNGNEKHADLPKPRFRKSWMGSQWTGWSTSRQSSTTDAPEGGQS